MGKGRTSRRTRADTGQKRDSRASIPVMDAFSNPAARIGWGTMDLMNATAYPMTRMTGDHQLLTSLYRDNWIVQNIIATIPNDMIRKWYEIKSAIEPEYIDQMKHLERQTQIRKRSFGNVLGKALRRGSRGDPD